MSDNLISARLVLANGSAITVSATEHSDLFWGIQGAGKSDCLLDRLESSHTDGPAISNRS